MADFVDRVREEINDRLKELRPALEELRRLEAAAAALDGVGAAPRAAESPKAAPRAARRPGRPRRARAAASAAPASQPATPRRGVGRPKGSGGRSAEALALVVEQPGIAIPEIAGKMGIKQNYLYRILPGLEQEGKVEKRGRGWHPRDGAAS